MTEYFHDFITNLTSLEVGVHVLIFLTIAAVAIVVVVELADKYKHKDDT